MKKGLIFILSMLLVGCYQTSSSSVSSLSSRSEQIIEKKDYKNATELFLDGYECSSIYSETKFAGLFHKQNGGYYVLVANMSEEKLAELDAIDFFDEHSSEKTNKVIETLEQVSLECINDEIPSQIELNTYVGKTIGDMLDEGYDAIGYNTYDMELDLDNCEITLLVGVESKKKIKSFDALSDKEYRSLVITRVEFVRISNNYIDKYID